MAIKSYLHEKANAGSEEKEEEEVPQIIGLRLGALVGGGSPGRRVDTVPMALVRSAYMTGVLEGGAATRVLNRRAGFRRTRWCRSGNRCSTGKGSECSTYMLANPWRDRAWSCAI